MGYWENTTYIRSDNAASVIQALDDVFEREGRLRIPAPPIRTPEQYDPMQYGTGAENDLWGVAIFPGSSGWCVLKSAPLELLAETAFGSTRMRLADLCVTLGVSAFQINIYDSISEVLLEMSADGSALISGTNFEGDGDLMVWHGMILTEERCEPRFDYHGELAGLLPSEYSGGDDLATAISEEIAGSNSEFCDNMVSVDTLNAHRPFTAPGGTALYYRKRGR